MDNNKNIITLIFSKNRALQLDLCLNSLYQRCQDIYLSDINILYKVDELHRNSYEILKKEHPLVTFIEETIFRQNVLNLLDNKNYILFVTDDTIFVDNFSLKDITFFLDQNKNGLGFSLRLGKNTQWCYPYNAKQHLPRFEKIVGSIIEYLWLYQDYDFSYPLEVSSSLYRVKDILDILHDQNFSNPNNLESVLNFYTQKFFYEKPYLLCYEQSVAFANPLNRVQQVALANRFSNSKDYSPEELLKQYECGLRINPNKFYKFVPNAAHQEVDLF